VVIVLRTAGCSTWLPQFRLQTGARVHLAAFQGHASVVRALLDAGADRHIKDSKFSSDALGWARHANRADVARLLAE
jgi:hypothetical protein